MTMRKKIEKFTDIRPVVMDGFPDAHNVFLQVANQWFCCSPYGCDTKEDAEWLRDMLCVALEEIVRECATVPASPCGLSTFGRE